MKRLGIFQMNDYEGLVDDYILYLLNDILPNLDELIIVVNGMIQTCETVKLHNYTNKIFFRSNEGFDAIAYKETIIQFLGIEYVRGFDELLIFNDTFFGPFYSSKIIFQKMEKKYVDFWGLTLHAEHKSKSGYMPEHLQSYFLVVRKEMLNSVYFEKFWLSLENIGTFRQLVNDFEIHFTTFFKKHGFRYAAYVEDYNLNGDPQYNFNHYAYLPYTLMDKYKMPVLKRKNFLLPLNTELTEAMVWIEENTDYDVKMIWKNIIRTYDIYDLKKSLNLKYILSDIKESEHKSHNPVAILAYLENENILKEKISYLHQFSDRFDIYILTNKKGIYDEVCKKLKQKTCMVISNNGEVYAFIKACKNLINQYAHIGFVFDKYTNVPTEYYIKSISLDYIIWENILGSNNYIDNIITQFEKDYNLGLLSVPEPIHSKYIKSSLKEWEEIYPILLYYISQMGLKCKIDKKKRPHTFLPAFWCKTDAIRKIIEYPFSNEELKSDTVKKCIKYLMVYASQDAGYYSGTVKTIKYSKLEIENQNMLIDQYMQYFYKKEEVEKFVRKYRKIYIYGMGIVAKRVQGFISECGCSIEKFVITDSHYEQQKIDNANIIPISKVPKDEDIGIIVAMNAKNTREVKPFLDENNYKNIFYMSEEEN